MVQFSTELDRAAAVTYSAASPPVGLARRANADLQIGRGQPGAFRLDILQRSGTHPLTGTLPQVLLTWPSRWFGSVILVDPL